MQNVPAAANIAAGPADFSTAAEARQQASILSSASQAEPSRPDRGSLRLPQNRTEPQATFRGGTLSGKCKMLDTVFIQFLLGGGDTEVEVELEGGLVTLEYYVVS